MSFHQWHPRKCLSIAITHIRYTYMAMKKWKVLLYCAIEKCTKWPDELITFCSSVQIPGMISSPSPNIPRKPNIIRVTPTDLHNSTGLRHHFKMTKFWKRVLSVETEADFWPPAGAGAPADRGQGWPAEFRGPCCTPVTPEAPVVTRVPVTSEGP